MPNRVFISTNNFIYAKKARKSNFSISIKTEITHNSNSIYMHDFAKITSHFYFEFIKFVNSSEATPTLKLDQIYFAKLPVPYYRCNHHIIAILV